jgi:hypothetical protein
MADEAGSHDVFAAESSSESPMNEATALHVRNRARWRRRLILISGLVALLGAGLVLPPLISIGRYQRQITALMSRSLGRPVHLSGVELRLLPSPGFVLHDLSVSEDPSFGTEPILSARTVMASVRILSLWQGKLVVNRITVDDASLNLVRSPQGRWNLQSLMTGGLQGAQGSANPAAVGALPRFSRKPAPFPYLEATNSRVNLKNGAEKSPFALVGTDLSLWQDQPGAWRLRLRGQPVRTDMEMSPADAGQVQVEASLQSAVPVRELREMPLKLQAEWRDAQLGQLSRLLLGSDAGWRGDVTADLEMQGTPDAAQTKARLRATGVRRAEFAPETPLDFDANCSFRYQHSQNAVRGLGCDTAIGDGQLHLKADLPGDSGKPEATLEVHQIPLQAGLDLLRTVRSGFAPGIVAQGSATGSLSLLTSAPVTKSTGRHGAAAARSQRNGQDGTRKDGAGKDKSGEDKSGPLNLQGTLTMEHGLLKGGGLKDPITLPRITWTPTLLSDSSRGSGFETGLSSRFTVSLGAAPAPEPPASGTGSPSTTTGSPSATPSKSDTSQAVARPQEITVRLGLTADGYDVAVAGSAGTAKLRDVAYAFGAPHLDALDSFARGTADIDLTAAGPWITSSDAIFLQAAADSGLSRAGLSRSGSSRSGPSRASALPTEPAPAPLPGSDLFSGSLQLHHTEWKSPYLARAVEFSQGAVNIIPGSASIAPIVSMTSDFAYGALKGSMTVNAPINCKTGDCQPQVQLRLGAMDAGDLAVALLGVPEKKSLLSPLMDRMRSSERPKWPAVTVNVQADSLVLGPTTLHKPLLRMRMEGGEIALESWEAGLLDGSAKGTGHCTWTDAGLKYAIEGDFTKLSAASLGAILNGKRDGGKDAEADSGAASQWSGDPLNGSGSIQLSGLTSQQLAASATGSVRFNWPHGSLSSPAKTTADAASTDASQPEMRFDDWSGTATIQGGKVQLAENVMHQGKRSVSVVGVIPFGGPAKLAIGPAHPVGPVGSVGSVGTVGSSRPANGKTTGSTGQPTSHPAPHAPVPPTVQ